MWGPFKRLRTRAWPLPASKILVVREESSFEMKGSLRQALSPRPNRINVQDPPGAVSRTPHFCFRARLVRRSYAPQLIQSPASLPLYCPPLSRHKQPKSSPAARAGWNSCNRPDKPATPRSQVRFVSAQLAAARPSRTHWHATHADPALFTRTSVSSKRRQRQRLRQNLRRLPRLT